MEFYAFFLRPVLPIGSRDNIDIVDEQMKLLGIVRQLANSAHGNPFPRTHERLHPFQKPLRATFLIKGAYAIDRVRMIRNVQLHAVAQPPIPALPALAHLCRDHKAQDGNGVLPFGKLVDGCKGVRMDGAAAEHVVVCFWGWFGHGGAFGRGGRVLFRIKRRCLLGFKSYGKPRQPLG